MLIANLSLATLMVALTVTVHFLGLTALISRVKRHVAYRPMRSTVIHQSAMILALVLALFALHTIEIWLYAILYMLLGEFSTIEGALYFSTTTFTTVGYGDVFLDERWRMLAAIESANGFLLLGWSTAYLVSLTGVMRDIERELAQLASEDRRKDDAAD